MCEACAVECGRRVNDAVREWGCGWRECECACDLECGCCACLEGTGMRGPGAKLDGKTRSEAVARCGAAEGWCWWGLRWPEGWAAEGVAEWMWPEGVAE